MATKKVKAVVEEAPRKKRKTVDETAEPGVDLAAIYGSVMDEVSKRQGADDGLASDMTPMSTGMLAYDLILGGGIRPAWYTNFGAEQSAKTTGALTILASSVKNKVPIKKLFDYEGSTGNSIPYVQNILQSAGVKQSVEEVFGKRDPVTGRWVIKPIVSYSSETVGEKFFNVLHDMLKTLPDKKKLGKSWWLIFEPTKLNKSKYSSVSAPAMAKKYGPGIYVPAADGCLQALVITDSYPAMNPTSNDEDEQDKSLALQARMFSKHLPRVKGRLAQKMVAVLGINQLRSNPMVKYGPPESEPCGQALRFTSDVRMRHTPRALGSAVTCAGGIKPIPHPDDKSVEIEKSVQFDGNDTYRYIAVKTDKNKLWTPKRIAWIRIWVEDANGEAQGLDPVYDTYWYLFVTGQISGNKRNALTVNLEGLGKSAKPMAWSQLKRWILGSKEEKLEISERCGYEPMDLRKFCFHQMAEGAGERLYIDHKNSKSKGGGDDNEIGTTEAESDD